MGRYKFCEEKNIFYFQIMKLFWGKAIFFSVDRVRRNKKYFIFGPAVTGVCGALLQQTEPAPVAE